MYQMTYLADQKYADMSGRKAYLIKRMTANTASSPNLSSQWDPSASNLRGVITGFTAVIGGSPPSRLLQSMWPISPAINSGKF